MTCFPLDNTRYEAKDMGAYLATRTRGVFSAENNLAVTPGESGLSVLVSPGLAWLRWSEFWGACALQEQALTINLDAADGVLQRIDVIVCRLDKVNNRAEIVAKKGAFSSDPIVELPVRNANFDEIYLATVRVRAGAIKLNGTDITDQRLNETYCGLMRDGVTGIPTAQLHAQWAAFFAQSQQDETNRQQQADEAFVAWFNHVKELWADDPAGSLQTQIDKLQEQKADAETVTKALASKADVSAVNDALAGKADASVVNKAVETAQTTANSAQTAANSAKTTANNALPKAGGTVTGQLVLSKTTDVSGTASSEGALVIGNKTGTHIAFDGNEIMAKTDATTPGTLNINLDGGMVTIGPGGLKVNGTVVLTAISNAQTTANNAMPKAGGTFTGNVIAYDTNRGGKCLRNARVYNTTGTTAQSTDWLKFVRK